MEIYTTTMIEYDVPYGEWNNINDPYNNINVNWETLKPVPDCGTWGSLQILWEHLSVTWDGSMQFAFFNWEDITTINWESIHCTWDGIEEEGEVTPVFKKRGGSPSYIGYDYEYEQSRV